MRRKLLAITTTIITVLMGGAALAAFLSLTSITGTINTGSIQVLLIGTPTAQATNGDCTVERSNGGTAQNSIDVTWSGMVSGDTCTLTIPMAAEANAVNVQLDGATLPAITGGEVTAMFGDDCATVVSPGANVSPVPTLVLSVTSAADPGTIYDLTGSVFGWVPEGQATNCI